MPAKLASIAAAQAAAIFLALPSPAARAESLMIDAPACAETIEIRAQEVPLRKVLEQLAASLAFRFDSPLPLAEPVTMSRRGPPDKVLKQLLRSHNLVLQTDPSSRCRGASAVSVVRVLPAGEEAAPSTSVSERPPAPASAARQERPRGTRRNMGEDAWQQMKEDYKAGRIKADPETGQPVPVDQ